MNMNVWWQWEVSLASGEWRPPRVSWAGARQRDGQSPTRLHVNADKTKYLNDIRICDESCASISPDCNKLYIDISTSQGSLRPSETDVGFPVGACD